MVINTIDGKELAYRIPRSLQLKAVIRPINRSDRDTDDWEVHLNTRIRATSAASVNYSLMKIPLISIDNSTRNQHLNLVCCQRELSANVLNVKIRRTLIRFFTP